MKANQYIKEFGLERAKSAIKNAPIGADIKLVSDYFFKGHFKYTNLDLSKTYHSIDQTWSNSLFSVRNACVEFTSIDELRVLIKSLELVENVGGYESAKAAFDSGAEYYIEGLGFFSNLACVGASECSVVNATLHNEGDFLPITLNSYFNTVNSVIEFNETLSLDELENALLVYRKEHNIFESGDICKISTKHDYGLYEFLRENGDRIYLKDRLGFAEFGITKSAVSHATPSEIEGLGKYERCDRASNIVIKDQQQEIDQLKVELAQAKQSISDALEAFNDGSYNYCQQTLEKALRGES